MKRILSWIAYPAVMVIGVSLYFGLINQGYSYELSSYIAAMVGGFVLITILELVIPYRREWLPNWQEIKTDFFFMVIVQVLLPKFLSIFAVVLLQSYFDLNSWGLRLWPSNLNIWTQMLLMMFSADFFRYWLHRFAHTWIPLWRFHAVHHSVQKLYWFNVGRFHPVDKAAQFFCDALPFIVLGVSREVLTLYFVIYSIKGFFQHSNVDVKLGPLNYIISGPELHRWHHSKVIEESSTNYGNNVIVWDILFGTYFLPKDREVGDLGLMYKTYPMDFFGQLKKPFVKPKKKAK